MLLANWSNKLAKLPNSQRAKIDLQTPLYLICTQTFRLDLLSYLNSTYTKLTQLIFIKVKVQIET